MKHWNKKSLNFYAFLKTESTLIGACISRFGQNLSSLLRLWHRGKHGMHWNICPLRYHQNVRWVHMFGKYLLQIEMIILITVCPYEYGRVFITIILILKTLQDKILPIEKNLQFCTLFNKLLDKLVDGARKINFGFLYDCKRLVQFLINVSPQTRHTFIKSFSCVYSMPKMPTPLPKCPLRYPISSNGVDSDEFCHTQFILNAIGNVLLNRSQTLDQAYNII